MWVGKFNQTVLVTWNFLAHEHTFLNCRHHSSIFFLFPLNPCKHSWVHPICLPDMETGPELCVCFRCAPSQHHLRLLQETWDQGNAVEVQGMFWLRPVHAVLHEQQARPLTCFRALRDRTLTTVSHWAEASSLCWDALVTGSYLGYSVD